MTLSIQGTTNIEKLNIHRENRSDTKVKTIVFTVDGKKETLSKGDLLTNGGIVTGLEIKNGTHCHVEIDFDPATVISLAAGDDIYYMSKDEDEDVEAATRKLITKIYKEEQAKQAC